MTVLNPNATSVATAPTGSLGGLLTSEWQELLQYIVGLLGGPTFPAWPAPGQPEPWYPSPAGGWGLNGNPPQPVAGQVVTLHEVVDYVRAHWPTSINGTAFPALGSQRIIGGVTVTVQLSGDGVAASAAGLGLTF